MVLVMPRAYKVRCPTTRFPSDFWVLAEAEGQVMLESAEGTYLTTRKALRQAEKDGLIEVVPESV